MRWVSCLPHFQTDRRTARGSRKHRTITTRPPHSFGAVIGVAGEPAPAQFELPQFDQELVFLGAEVCMEGDNLGFKLVDRGLDNEGWGVHDGLLSGGSNSNKMCCFHNQYYTFGTLI